MVQFDILDCPIFLSWDPPILLLANAPVTVISCIVASVAQSSSWS
jgi:hypothetical protein